MKMAKATEADLDMAMELCNVVDGLGNHWPTLPDALCPDSEESNDRFYREDDAQCGLVLRHLLDVADRGSLMRVIWGCSVMLHPANKCVDPSADTIEHHPDAVAGLKAKEPRPLAEWQESDGAVLWWRFPVVEAPYCGTPNTDGWPGYHTHWTALIVPEPPEQVQADLPGIPAGPSPL